MKTYVVLYVTYGALSFRGAMHMLKVPLLQYFCWQISQTRAVFEYISLKIRTAAARLKLAHPGAEIRRLGHATTVARVLPGVKRLFGLASTCCHAAVTEQTGSFLRRSAPLPRPQTDVCLSRRSEISGPRRRCTNDDARCEQDVQSFSENDLGSSGRVRLSRFVAVGTKYTTFFFCFYLKFIIAISWCFCII